MVRSLQSLSSSQSQSYRLLGFILIFAPLFRSGQPPLAILVLELLALALILLALWQPGTALTRRESLRLIALLCLPLFYLVPLPEFLAQLLPGRQPYWEAFALLGIPEGQWFSLSLYPRETASAFLLLLVPVGVFLAVRRLEYRQVLRLIYLLLGIACFQALLGLLQYMAARGGSSPQFLGLSIQGLPSASGTYTNRNHLAGLLNLVFPLALALAIFNIGHRERNRQKNWRDQVVFFASLRGHLAFFYGMIALLLLLGIIFTRSRAGIALSMMGILLSTLLFARRIGGDNVYGTVGTVIALTIGSALTIGLIPVLDRFSVGGAAQDARWAVFSATLDGIGTFMPLGSGPGNYPDLFPRFQPLSLGHWFINHAHNDYLEWLFETGILGGLLIALFLWAYFRRWGQVWTTKAWSRFRFLQIASGIGLLLMLLHSLVDFNLHIPANIVFFAFLAGVFFSPVQDVSKPHRRRKRRTPTFTEEGTPPPVPATLGAHTPPPEQIPNPFLDP